MKKISKIFKTMFMMIVAVLIVAVSVCAYSTVKYGSNSNEVKTMQTMLNAVMNSNLSVDGKFGPATLSALKSYQKSSSLQIDGICGPKTWEKLEKDYNYIANQNSNTNMITSRPDVSSYPTLKNGANGNYVKILQNWLNDVFKSGLDADGKFGSKTLNAVTSYQKYKGLSVDGICGPKTWNALADDICSSTKAESKITIGEGKYNPVSIKEGKTYSISGTLTSVYPITSVTVGIYNSNGTPTKYVKTVAPNSNTYNIFGVDNFIKFALIPAGNYFLRVEALDANGYTTRIVNNSFTVVGRPKVTLELQKYQDAANATYEKQIKEEKYYSMCVLTSFSMLVKSKLYFENKDYGDIDQKLIYSYNNEEKKEQVSIRWSHCCATANSYLADEGDLNYKFLGSDAIANKDYIIQLLSSRPEGVVVFFDGTKSDHAVLFRNYDDVTNTFWVTDPVSSKDLIYVPFEDSTVITNKSRYGFQGSLTKAFANVSAIIYYE